MADKSGIEWTDATWNPVTGCTRVSEGCDHCYIERTPPFRMAGRRFDGTGPGSATGVLLHPDRLDQPLRWRKPRRVFVNSLADLFHDNVPDEFLNRVWSTMEQARDHTFQVLTKRPARMRAFLLNRQARKEEYARKFEDHLIPERRTCPAAVDARRRADNPPANIWIGVSVENQRWADIRIPLLLSTPAAVRWISAEPLLGPIDLTRVAYTAGGGTHLDVVHGRHGQPGVWSVEAQRLDWVVAGGESGPGARPMHPDWARSLRDQCASARIPFHFKQWGEFIHNPSLAEQWMNVPIHAVASVPGLDPYEEDASVSMWRVGKKRAGRELDGRTHDDYPIGSLSAPDNDSAARTAAATLEVIPDA